MTCQAIVIDDADRVQSLEIVYTKKYILMRDSRDYGENLQVG